MNRVSFCLLFTYLQEVEVDLVDQRHYLCDTEAFKNLFIIEMLSALINSCIGSQEFDNLDLFLNSGDSMHKLIDNNFKSLSVRFLHKQSHIITRDQTETSLDNL